MSFQFQLAFGWAAPSILHQLSEYGLCMDDGLKEYAQKIQKFADAISLLTIGGPMRASEAKRLRNAIARDCEKWLVEHGYAEPAEQSA